MSKQASSNHTPTRIYPAGLWSRGELELLDHCPACGGQSHSSYKRRDDAGAMPDVWSMASCSSCDSLYLNPRPTPASLQNAYSDYYTHHASHESKESIETSGLLEKLVNGYLNQRFGMDRQPAHKIGAVLFSVIEPLRLKLNFYGRNLPRLPNGSNKTLLDVGCGNGEFLLRARSMGWNSMGCEPDALAAKTCQNQDLRVISGDAFCTDLNGMQFSVITLNHVLEHVLEPKALLKRLHDLLEPGGMIWIALPNPAALGLVLFKQGWKGLHVPFHLLIPSHSILHDWMEQSGYTAIRFNRRGPQSPGLWRETLMIARREGVLPSAFIRVASRLILDALATVTPRWSEETVVVAHKPK